MSGTNPQANQLKRKWHIGKNGPSPCHVKVGKCPYGGQHYPTYEEAMGDYSEKLSKQYGVTKTVMTDHLEKRLRNKIYKRLDKNDALYKTYTTMRRLGKTTIAITGITTLGTVTMYRFIDSFVDQKPMKRFRKNEAKKLLMIKHWH